MSSAEQKPPHIEFAVIRRDPDGSIASISHDLGWTIGDALNVLDAFGDSAEIVARATSPWQAVPSEEVEAMRARLMDAGLARMLGENGS